MSVVVMLMIGGWIATLSMIGVCALHECGKLLRIRRRIALWLLDASAAQILILEQDIQPERENAL
jgi:hypothetical protein